jgi:hypothetical protein
MKLLDLPDFGEKHTAMTGKCFEKSGYQKIIKIIKLLHRNILVMLRKSVLACSLIFFSGTGFAATPHYQYEITGSYFNTEYGQQLQSQNFSFSFERYFKPIKLNAYPYAEADFFDRTGSVKFSFGRSVDDTPEVDHKNIFLGLSVSYMAKQSPVKITGRLETVDGEYKQDYKSLDYATDNFGISVEGYATKELMVGFSFDKSKTRISRFLISLDEQEVLQLGLGVKWVKIITTNQAVGLRVNFYNQDYAHSDVDVSSSTVSGDFYITLRNNIGAELTKVDDSEYGTTTIYTYYFRSFITRNFSVDAAYTISSEENPDYEDGTGYSIRIQKRF